MRRLTCEMSGCKSTSPTLAVFDAASEGDIKRSIRATEKIADCRLPIADLCKLRLSFNRQSAIGNRQSEMSLKLKQVNLPGCRFLSARDFQQQRFDLPGLDLCSVIQSERLALQDKFRSTA